MSVVRNNGVSAIWGFSCTEVYGKMVGLLELSVMLWVSAVEGCPLSKVPL